MPTLGKVLILIGIGLVAIGLLIAVMPKLPYLGKLPGDIRIEKENFTFYFPFTTCLLLSALLSLILWFFRQK